MVQDVILKTIIDIKNIINNNSGIVSAISPIIAYWLGIKTIKKTEGRIEKRHQKNLDSLLLEELYFNMMLLSDIDRIFNKNKTMKSDNLYIPAKSPRITIIEKYTSHDIISSLDIRTRRYFLNTYHSLKLVEKEYYEWRRLFSSDPNLKSNEVWFDQFSLPMSSALTKALQEVIQLWAIRVEKSGKDSDIQFVKNLSKKMRRSIKNGKWLKTYHKASEYINDIDSEKVDIIICWENDLDNKDSGKEVIELRSLPDI